MLLKLFLKFDNLFVSSFEFLVVFFDQLGHFFTTYTIINPFLKCLFVLFQSFLGFLQFLHFLSVFPVDTMNFGISQGFLLLNDTPQILSLVHV